MKVVMIGDIYGKTGRNTLKHLLPILGQRYAPDWVIANGENATGGNGLSAAHARFIKGCGVDVITTGNHIFARPDWPEVLQQQDYILRPHNLAVDNPVGTGCRIFNRPNGSLAVINLAGRVFMENGSCPFAAFDRLLADIPAGTPIVVDFHAEATSEKQAFFWYANGKIAAAAGTHTHVQTSDERILPGDKTAVITDIGMTGAINSVLGVERETIVGRFRTGYSDKFLCAPGPGKIEGVCVDIGDNGFANRIERFRLLETG